MCIQSNILLLCPENQIFPEMNVMKVAKKVMPQSFSLSNYSEETLCLLQNKLSYCFTLTLLFHIHPFPFKFYLTLQALCGLLTSTFILTAVLKVDRQFLPFVNVPYWLVLYHQQLITVTPCSPVETDHCIGGTCCLHLQFRSIIQRGHTG